MATIWNTLGEMMVLVGDLLALVAAGAGLLALLGEQRGWGAHVLRQIWSNSLFALLLGLVGLVAKSTTGGLADQVNGYVFGFSDTLVGALLLAALLLLAFAYWLRRQGPSA